MKREVPVLDAQTVYHSFVGPNYVNVTIYVVGKPLINALTSITPFDEVPLVLNSH